MGASRTRKNPADDNTAFIQQHLDVVASVSPLHAYVRDKGLFIESAKMTVAELEFLNQRLVPAAKLMPQTRTFQPKQCFHNSQMVALAYELLTLKQPNLEAEFKLEYFEGFYFMKNAYFFAIHHGWCMLNGKVLDFTLTQEQYQTGVVGEENKVVGVIPNGDYYLGSALPISDVRERMEAFSATNTLLDDHERSFPYLQPYMLALRGQRRSRQTKGR